MDALSPLRTSSAAPLPPREAPSAPSSDRVTLGDPAEAPPLDLRAAARALDAIRATGEDALSVWRLDVGHYDGKAFVSPDGRLYEGGLDRNFRALGADGRVLWERSAGDNDLSVSPALGPDGSLYVSRVVALEAWSPDGTLRWSQPLSDSLQLAAACGPEGNAYVQDHGRLYAVDRDGRVLWKQKVEPAWSDDPPVVGRDGTVHVVGKDSVVRAFTPDGREKWRFEGLRKDEGFLADVTTRLALGPGGEVYFGDRFGKVHCLGPDGRERWAAKLDGELSHYEGPSVDGQGRVYAGAARDSSTVVCLDPATGAEAWRRDVGSVLHVTGAPGGGVLVGVKGGPLHCLDERGRQVWAFREDTVFTRPVFGPEGTLYTGAGKTLYAVRPGATLAEQGARAAREAAATPPEAGPEIVQEGGWILVGEVRLPVKE